MKSNKKKQKKYYAVNWGGEDRPWGIIEFIKERPGPTGMYLEGKILQINSNNWEVGQTCVVTKKDSIKLKKHEFIALIIKGDIKL